jgi:hypothetical protein
MRAALFEALGESSRNHTISLLRFLGCYFQRYFIANFQDSPVSPTAPWLVAETDNV